MIAGLLEIQIATNIARLSDDMRKARSTVEGAMGGITQSVEMATKALGALGIGLGLNEIKNYVAEVIHMRGAMDDLADTTGDTVQSLDGLRRQAVISGSDFSAVGDALTKLAKNLNGAGDEGQAANAALKALGLSVTDLRNQKPGEAYETIARALAKFEDGASKVAVAMALMGKSGAAQLPLMKDIAEHGRLVGKMTTEQAAEAELLEKKWRALKLTFIDAGDAIMNPLIKAMSALVDKMKETKTLLESGSWVEKLRGIGNLPIPVVGILAKGAAMAADAMGVGPSTHGASGTWGGGASGTFGTPVGKKLTFDLEAAKRAEAARQAALNERLALEKKAQEELFKSWEKYYDDLENVQEIADAAERKHRSHALTQIRKSVEDEMDADQARGEAFAAEAKARDDAILGISTYIEQIKFETTLIGMNNQQRETAIALRGIELSGLGKSSFAYQKMAEGMKDSIAERTAAERSWSTGSQSAINDYIDHASNAAEQSARLFGNAFRNMEDALVSFVQTGKLDFKSLANSIISDLIRIQIQQSLITPIKEAGGIAGFFGKYFGGGGGDYYAAGAGTYSGAEGAANFVGPVMGSLAVGSDYIPRTGLYELHQGESVTTAADNARSGGPVFNVDMRGASLEAVQRLEAFVRQVNGSIESRAIGAVVNQSRRDPGFTRALR